MLPHQKNDSDADGPPHKAGTAPLAGAGAADLAPLGADAAAAARMTAAPPSQTDESPGGCNAEASKTLTQTDSISVTTPNDDRKLFATLKAEFALRGFSLWQLSDGSLLASGFPGWPPKPLPDLHAALMFLRRLGGAE